MKTKGIVIRFAQFYIIVFLLAFVLGHLDYGQALRRDVNDRDNPIFTLPMPVSRLDGGTRTWIGLGYYLTRRNQLEMGEARSDRMTYDVISGWELRPWGIFGVPVFGNTLFEKEQLWHYKQVVDHFDLRTDERAGRASVDFEMKTMRKDEDLWWAVSSIAIIFLFGLHSLVVKGIKHIIIGRSNKAIE